MGIVKSCDAHFPVFMIIALIIKIALVSVTNSYYDCLVASHWQYLPVPEKVMCLSVWC